MLQKRLSSIIFLVIFIELSGCKPSTTAPADQPRPSATVPPATATNTMSNEPTRALFLDVPTATTEASSATLPPPVFDYEHAIPHLAAGEEIEIIKIEMSDSKRGWAIAQANEASDHILRTDDGGETWWDITPPETAPTDDAYLQAAAFFLDQDNAWVSFQLYEIIWHTSDAGITWHPSRTAYASNFGVDFYFADETYGWVLKYLDAGMSHVYSAMARTTSGGAYWETVFDPYTSSDLQSFSKTGMVFIDAEIGWVTRDSGGVQPGAFVDATDDGGNTWQEIPLPPPQDEPNKFIDEYCSMYDPHLSSRNAGALTVRCTRYDDGDKVLTEYLFSTTDGGQTWRRDDFPGGELRFVNDSVAYALGRKIYRSRDAGKTWSHVKDVNWSGQFSFVNENLAWVVARAGDEIALVKTTDGCSSFVEIQPELIAAPSEYQVASKTEAQGESFETLTGQIGLLAQNESGQDVYDIFLLDLEDQSRRQITDGSGNVLNFSWSPDGQRLVFDSDKDGDYEIYIINVDGSQLIQLTNNSIQDNDPDWSPDGTQIVYTVWETDRQAIYIMNSDGTNTNRLTTGFTPSWSPDGSRIAFGRLEDGIFTIDPGGGNLTRLTDSSTYGWDYYPEWSPDGTKILFGSNRHQPGDALTESVYIMDADGKGVGRLTQSWGQAPYTWSPDGRWIVYTKDFISMATLYIMDAYGVNTIPLADNNIGFYPVWRP